MKISLLLCAALLSSAAAFSPSFRPVASNTACYMFSGGGAAVPKEDNPEEQAAIEQAAKSMGMSVEEYQLGLSARMKLVEALNSARVKAGDDKISVERDGNNPPAFLEITVSDDGKALGQDELSKQLCAALKKASDESRNVRTEAQKNMMQFIQDEMKK